MRIINAREFTFMMFGDICFFCFFFFYYLGLVDLRSFKENFNYIDFDLNSCKDLKKKLKSSNNSVNFQFCTCI